MANEPCDLCGKEAETAHPLGSLVVCDTCAESFLRNDDEEDY